MKEIFSLNCILLENLPISDEMRDFLQRKNSQFLLSVKDYHGNISYQIDCDEFSEWVEEGRIYLKKQLKELNSFLISKQIKRIFI